MLDHDVALTKAQIWTGSGFNPADLDALMTQDGPAHECLGVDLARPTAVVKTDGVWRALGSR